MVAHQGLKFSLTWQSGAMDLVGGDGLMNSGLVYTWTTALGSTALVEMPMTWPAVVM